MLFIRWATRIEHSKPGLTRALLASDLIIPQYLIVLPHTKKRPKSSCPEEQPFYHEVLAGEMYVTDTAEKCVSQMCIW